MYLLSLKKKINEAQESSSPLLFKNKQNIVGLSMSKASNQKVRAGNRKCMILNIQILQIHVLFSTTFREVESR